MDGLVIEHSRSVCIPNTPASAAALAESDETTTQDSWGCRSPPQDIRVFEQYNRLLRRLGKVGEWTVWVLFVATLGTYLRLLAVGDFENVVFWDGSNRACVLVGATGEIAGGH
jgi:hypothetical protein